MIVLPFPPSSLSGHANGNWRSKSGPTAKHRKLALERATDAGLSVPDEGDIGLHIHFVPPDRRGDRCNFWNRCKPYIDGIAEALGVNDSRFLPSKSFADPEKPGRVEISLSPITRAELLHLPLREAVSCTQSVGSDASANSTSEPDHNASEVRDDC